MVILAAKSTDAHFEEAKRGFQLCGGGWFGELCLCGGFVSVVVKAFGAKCEFNRGVDHFCVWFPLFKGSRPDQPPNRYEVSPHLVPAMWRISCLNSDHKGHRKRKWSTVSTPFSHLHCVEDAAPITPRYRFNWQIPVRSWQRMAAWSIV